ncbi:MAG: YajG family lipoprotein [Proteobacteria bacterium]|nr:YajG family lipoprotein [Pseudomonadota bacterium]MBU1715683.1 YajG family lipoprotein [Pseudomonadota bacterium]
MAKKDDYFFGKFGHENFTLRLSMRRLGLFFLLILLLVPGGVEAGRRSEIRLKVPEPTVAGKSGQLIVLGRINDNRHFEDRPAEADTPSIAEGTVATINADQRRYYIARVRDGYGKARNNIFLAQSQPVDEVVRELLTKSLTARGYKVVSDQAKGSDKAITMDVEIDQLWGFIEVKGGGFSGSIPKMAGRLKTVLIVKGPEGKARYEVSGSALHGFGLMTGGHWVKMFEELFRDYQKNLERVSF